MNTTQFTANQLESNYRWRAHQEGLKRNRIKVLLKPELVEKIVRYCEQRQISPSEYIIELMRKKAGEIAR
ncbi:MAG: hypothetical protein LV480_01105 [Methylacidiphilales bacterium]|nr:hypothetical protein [Candidatus Methylacidiphilales bacterium]